MCDAQVKCDLCNEAVVFTEDHRKEIDALAEKLREEVGDVRYVYDPTE
jgi:hypothetical protein